LHQRFRYSGPPLSSLQGLEDCEQVIYVGTLKKAPFPGLRIALRRWCRGPRDGFSFGARYLKRPPTRDAAAGSRFAVHAARPLCRAYPRPMRQLYR
jgi:GntR family transcriptional regulator / MocR family aminotransferase